MNRQAAVGYIADWTRTNVEPANRDRFRELAESELLGLHEGNFARYRIRPAEYRAWRGVWSGSGHVADDTGTVAQRSPGRGLL